MKYPPQSWNALHMIHTSVYCWIPMSELRAHTTWYVFHITISRWSSVINVFMFSFTVLENGWYRNCKFTTSPANPIPLNFSYHYLYFVIMNTVIYTASWWTVPVIIFCFELRMLYTIHDEHIHTHRHAHTYNITVLLFIVC